MSTPATTRGVESSSDVTPTRDVAPFLFFGSPLVPDLRTLVPVILHPKLLINLLEIPFYFPYVVLIYFAVRD